MKKLKLPAGTILGGLTIFLTMSAQADFASSLRLSGGSAKLFYVESKIYNEELQSKLNSVESFLELKEGEKKVLEVKGGCDVTLQKNSLFVSLSGSAINSKFSGSKFFSLRGPHSPNTARNVTVSGDKGSRIIRGISVTRWSPGAQYNDYIAHPVEQFCQNFVEKNENYQTRNFLVGNETNQIVMIDEKSNSILISEEGSCNGTRHKAIISCQLPANQTLEDFLDYQQL